LQTVYTDIQSLGAELVVISPELPQFSADMAAKQGLNFPILHDAGLLIARAFGLAAVFPDDLAAIYLSFGIDLPVRNGHPEWELPIPGRFVVDRGGIIRAADVDPDYTQRPEAEDTLAVVKAIA
jgi:peroxiredoxin